jgi:hypothetical protein
MILATLTLFSCSDTKDIEKTEVEPTNKWDQATTTWDKTKWK